MRDLNTILSGGKDMSGDMLNKSLPLQGQSAIDATGLTRGAAAFPSGTYYIDALSEGLSWTGNSGQSASVAYTFGASHEGGALFNATQRTATLAVMQEWSNVANITFQEGSVLSPLTFSQRDLGAGVGGYTIYYYSGTRTSSAEVLIDDSVTNLVPNDYDYMVLLHEIGHALGIKHPGPYASDDPPPYLPSGEENHDATVMSYNDGTYTSTNKEPRTPMLYDIATAQYIYGANYSYNAGDSLYQFTGASQVKTIWDGGGSDVIDASPYTGGSVTLNLQEGLQHVSIIGGSDIWMAFGANIEHAIATGSGDTVSGNALANSLYGMGGNDAVYGNAGNDVIFGGTGITDPGDGSDQLYGGADRDTIYGNTGNDTIYGGTGYSDPTDAADTIYGGYGIDSLFGNAGDDFIFGGGGSSDPGDSGDLMYGGYGIDIMSGNAGADTIYGGGGTNDPADLGDTIYAGRGDDQLYGNGGADILYGHEGNDSLHGGLGNDTHVFQSGGGIDVILYFESAGTAGGDIIAIESNINGSGITSTTAALAHASYASGNAVIDLGGGNSVTIIGVTAFAIDDFSIV